MKGKPFADERDNEYLINNAPGGLKALKQRPFVNVTVADILWGSENPLLDLSAGMFKDRPDLLYPCKKFGIFMGKNGTYPGLMTAKTGIKDQFEDIGRVVAFQEKSLCQDKFEAKFTKLKFWKGDQCNAIKGTDGSAFPPDISRNQTLYLFNRDLCRSIPLVFQEDVTSSTVPGYRFAPPEDIFDPANPDNACFNMANGEVQTPKGIFNMSACQYGSPIMMSWPNFFQADQSLRNAVEGLKPDPTKHQFFMDIQPKLGVALKAQARSQINVQMYKMEGVEVELDGVNVIKGLRDMIFPVLWFESGIEGINDEHTLDLLHKAIYLPKKAKAAM